MLEQLIGPVVSLLDKFIPDKDKKNAIAFELATMVERHAQELAKGQLEVNKAQAQHSSMFVAGARPYIMWVCGFALTYAYVLYPILKFLTVIFMDLPPELPAIEMGELMPLLTGMLGFGAMRSWEKSKGVERKRVLNK